MTKNKSSPFGLSWFHWQPTQFCWVHYMSTKWQHSDVSATLGKIQHQGLPRAPLLRYPRPPPRGRSPDPVLAETQNDKVGGSRNALKSAWEFCFLGVKSTSRGPHCIPLVVDSDRPERAQLSWWTFCASDRTARSPGHVVFCLWHSLAGADLVALHTSKPTGILAPAIVFLLFCSSSLIF